MKNAQYVNLAILYVLVLVVVITGTILVSAPLLGPQVCIALGLVTLLVLRRRRDRLGDFAANHLSDTWAYWLFF